MDAVFLTDDLLASDVMRRWLKADADSAQLSPAYRVYYHFRRWLPQSVRWWLQRRLGSSAAPGADQWFLPNEFFRQFLSALQQEECTKPIIHPWPDAAQYAFVLTHDVETQDGLDRVAQIAELEEELGFRSSWNFVPQKYRIDRGLLNDLAERQFELGVHGYNHDGRLFASRRVFQKRAIFMNQTLRDFHAVGFRSPMVHRNLSWMQQLEIEYDSSCFDVDPYQAMPGGVGSIWPFVAGRFIELPYTMPQDHTLFITLGLEDGSIWQRKADWLAQRSGMMLMLTHPDYLDTERRRNIYRDFLQRIQEETDRWHALPRDVAAWWRCRDASEVISENETWRIAGPAAEEGRLARPTVHGNLLQWEPVGQLSDSA